MTQPYAPSNCYFTVKKYTQFNDTFRFGPLESKSQTTMILLTQFKMDIEDDVAIA